jgi:hypothetical protein
MREITLNNKNYLLVRVPNDVTWFEISENNLGNFINKELGIVSQQFLEYGRDKIKYYDADNFYLPKGKWKIVGKISDILKDEDICKGLVEDFIFNKIEGFTNYLYEFIPELKATDSFLSWLESIELDLTKQFLLIQKL